MLTQAELKSRLHYCTDTGIFIWTNPTAHNVKSGTGEKAAIESGRKFWLPPVVGEDFNDAWQAEGTFKMSQLLREFING